MISDFKVTTNIFANFVKFYKQFSELSEWNNNSDIKFKWAKSWGL